MPDSRRKSFPRASAALATAALAVAAFATPFSQTAAAASGQGLNGGWVVGDTGAVSFPHSLPSQMPIMREAGAGWVRMNFRLGNCYLDWVTPIDQAAVDDPARKCDPLLMGHTALQAYDSAVDAARANNLQVLGHLSNEAWHGDQLIDWQRNSAEVQGGNGDNAYIDAFASDAAGVVAEHFKGRITVWEVWNEPNAWTNYDDAGNVWGLTYLHPSNFAWLLSKSYAQIKQKSGGAATVVSGGLFGSDLSSPPRTTILRGATKHGEPGPSRRPAGAPDCADTLGSGSGYLCLTYAAGLAHAGWTRPYPFDEVGQHFYIDETQPTIPPKVTAYVQDVRRAYVAYEGTGTNKRTEVTEFGWSSQPGTGTYANDAQLQATNVRTTYLTLQSIPYVVRGYYFTVQDVPEGAVFRGLVQGDYRAFDQAAANLALRKPAFTQYQRTVR